MAKGGLGYRYADVFLLDGVRTPFVDYCGALAAVSPIDLGIKAARALFARTEVPPTHVGQAIAGSMAQASFDAYMLPRHIGLYAGVPIETPAILVQRVCGTGFELIAQAGDILTLGKAELALCVGTESMSRNPVAAYTHRTGFRLGQVEFKDFLWEALLDPAAQCTMGQTAENLARKYELARDEVDAFAASSFARALAAQQEGFLAGEIVPVASESFECHGMSPRAIKLDRTVTEVAQDSHIRPTPPEVLANLSPAFAAFRPAATAPPSSTALQPCWSPRATMRGRTGRNRLPASLPRRRWACRRRSWASGRCRRSGGSSNSAGSICATSTASRSTRLSARNASRSSARSALITPRSM